MSDKGLPVRRTPAKGVHLSLGRPNWVFVTVCTQDRGRWLAQPSVQRTLHGIWQDHAKAWLVTDYLLMPDHLHFFCAPYDMQFEVERWVAFWKDRFAKTHSDVGRFQNGAFHHRLRTDESYSEKWRYVQENPVRQGLVSRPTDWPYCGRVHDLFW